MKLYLIIFLTLTYSISYAEPSYDETISYIEQKNTSYGKCRRTEKITDNIEKTFEEKYEFFPKKKCVFDLIKTVSETQTFYNKFYPQSGPEIWNTKKSLQTYKSEGITFGDLTISNKHIKVDRNPKVNEGQNGSLATVTLSAQDQCGWEYYWVDMSLGNSGIPRYIKLEDGSWKEDGKSSHWILTFYDEQIANKVSKALNHAVKLCKEPF